MNDRLLKRIILEEIQKILSEESQQVTNQPDQKKVVLAGQLMAIYQTYIPIRLSELQGGGKPPQMLINGIPLFQWVIKTSGLTEQQIIAASQTSGIPEIPVP